MLKTASRQPRFYGALIGAVYVAAGAQDVVGAKLVFLARAVPRKKQPEKKVARLIARPKIAVAVRPLKVTPAPSIAQARRTLAAPEPRPPPPPALKIAAVVGVAVEARQTPRQIPPLNVKHARPLKQSHTANTPALLRGIKSPTETGRSPRAAAPPVAVLSPPRDTAPRAEQKVAPPVPEVRRARAVAVTPRRARRSVPPQTPAQIAVVKPHVPLPQLVERVASVVRPEFAAPPMRCPQIVP